MKVEINVSMVMNYSQVVDMTKEDFEQLENTDKDTFLWIDNEFEIIEKYLDYSDIADSEGEFTDIRIKAI